MTGGEEDVRRDDAAFPGRRAMIIVNPAARGALSARRIETAARALADRGWRVSVERTAAAGDATALAARAVAGGCDVVVACGGDGTVNEVVQALAGTRVALAVIAAGTVNIWARETGLPRDPVDAALLVDEGRRATVDLGLAGGRYFLLMASTGLDARVVPLVRPRLKRWLGPAAYVLRALRELPRYQVRHVTVLLDGREIDLRSLMLVLGNTRLYGGVLRITRDALVDDGLLDLCNFDPRGRPRVLTELWAVARARHVGQPDVLYTRAREVHVVTPGLPVQVDGEPAGVTPMVFRAVPRALRVVLPAGPLPPLFGNPGDVVTGSGVTG